jgi:AAA family ATP:ADP antiporter
MSDADNAPPPANPPLFPRLTGIQPDERAPLAIAFVYFFCVLASYYMLRPLRDQFSAQIGSENLWIYWSGTFVATLALTPVFGWLVARFPREKFIPVVYGFFIACIFAFVPAFRAQETLGPYVLGTVFYIWLSVFNLFVVSVFWSFMADLFDSEQSRRLFPVIALGGTAGAIAGPVVARLLTIEQLLFGAIVGMAICIACVALLSRRVQGIATASRHADGSSVVVGGTWWAGLKQIFAQPFLRKMVALVMLSEAIGTIAYALVADYVGAHYGTPEARKDFNAVIDLTTNVTVIALQAFVARWVLTRFGMGVGLVLPSILNVLVLLAVAFFGDIAVVAMLVITRAGAYGLFKPASDALYTRVDREARYKGKNVIDTAIWRFGDVVVSGGMRLLQPLAITVAGYALICAACASMAAWFGWRAAHAPDLAPEERRE